MVFVQKMDCSDHLVGFTQLRARVPVECPLELFNLSQLVQRLLILVGLQTKQRNVPFDFAGLGVNLSVIIFVNPLYYPQRVQSLIGHFGFVLELTESHHNLCQIVSICVLLKLAESVHGFLLGLDGLFKVSHFVVNFGHL